MLMKVRKIKTLVCITRRSVSLDRSEGMAITKSRRNRCKKTALSKGVFLPVSWREIRDKQMGMEKEDLNFFIFELCSELAIFAKLAGKEEDCNGSRGHHSKRLTHCLSRPKQTGAELVEKEDKPLLCVCHVPVKHKRAYVQAAHSFPPHSAFSM
jgi:hypothetical protein